MIDSKGTKVLASDGWIRYNGSVRLIEMKTTTKYKLPSGLLNPDMSAEEMRLHVGELTSREVLLVRAVIRWSNSQIKSMVNLTQKVDSNDN